MLWHAFCMNYGRKGANMKTDNNLDDHQHNQGQSSGHVRPEEQTPVSTGEKICITAQGSDLNSPIDPRFGRAQYFLVFDSKDLKIEAFKNSHLDEAQGVGIKSAQLLVSKGVSILLTGHVGPKANQVLESAGIQIITGISGTAKDVYNDFVNQVSDVS